MNCWLNEEDLFQKVFFLAGDGVVMMNPDKEELPRIAKWLSGGAIPEGALKKARGMLYGAITKVVKDERNTDITITYSGDKSSKVDTFSFAGKQDRDAAFAALRERLPGFDGSHEEMTPARAAVEPAVGFAVLAGLTYLFHGLAVSVRTGGEAAFHGRHALYKRIFHFLLDTLGPAGVVVVGAVLMAASIIVLVKRVKNPPILTTLQKG